jgi:dTDP-4-amino-4,6-dideoxygalactose transaminase
MKPLSYGRQQITTADIEAVTRALQADYLSGGPEIEAFEREFAAYIGATEAIAVANGTAALHLCALALDVQPGQRWLLPP